MKCGGSCEACGSADDHTSNHSDSDSPWVPTLLFPCGAGTLSVLVCIQICECAGGGTCLWQQQRAFPANLALPPQCTVASDSHAQQQWDHEDPKLRCLFKNTEIFFKSGTRRNKKENIKIIKMCALSREHHDNTLEIARTYGLMFLEAGVKTKMLAVLSLVLRAMWEESHPSLSPGSR